MSDDDGCLRGAIYVVLTAGLVVYLGITRLGYQQKVSQFSPQQTAVSLAGETCDGLTVGGQYNDSVAGRLYKAASSLDGRSPKVEDAIAGLNQVGSLLEELVQLESDSTILQQQISEIAAELGDYSELSSTDAEAYITRIEKLAQIAEEMCKDFYLTSEMDQLEELRQARQKAELATKINQTWWRKSPTIFGSSSPNQ